MVRFKTKDKVKWLVPQSRGKSAIWRYGKIIGWYAEDAPIIQVEIADEEGNTAFVYYTSALQLNEEEEN
jgi:hypothetical protein